MSKLDFEICVAFGTQSAEGTYNATLDALTDTITAANGLLLGDPGSGIRESGISLTLGRKKKDKPFLGSSYTRSLSDFLAAEVRTFTFAVPFVGNRVTVSGAPADADAIPLTGLDALLEGCGMEGTAWGTGVGHQYVFGSPNPISSLLYYSGERLELLDCRCQGAILFEPEAIPILTATIEVGSIKDHSALAFPTTLTWGEQSTVSAPVVEGVDMTWRDGPTRGGFSTATLNLSPTITNIGDSNAATGVVKETTDREVSIEATIFSDDATDDMHEYEQLTASSQATLDQISWLVGDVMADTEPAEAVGIIMDDPEVDEIAVANLGSKKAYTVKLLGRGSSTGNNELEINFQ